MNIQTTQNSVEILWLESWVYLRNGKLQRLSGRFLTLIWRPGDLSKIWSLLDYLGELTALYDANCFLDIPWSWPILDSLFNFFHSIESIFSVFVLPVIYLNSLKTRQNNYSTLHFKVFILTEDWSFIGTHLRAPVGDRLGKAS